jgi:omega-amidase
MRVSALQLKCDKKDPQATRRTARRLIHQAKQEDAEIACLPELWLPDEYTIKNERILKELQETAKKEELYLVTGALAQKNRDRREIVTHLISPEGELLGSQSKVHLFRNQREKYQPATTLKPIKTSLGSVGMLVCYDNVFPEAARKLSVNGADILLIPSRIVKMGIEPWHLYLKVRALENRIPIVAPNVIEPPLFNGHSLIVELDYDSKTEIVYPKAQEASTHEQTLTYDLDLPRSKKLRRTRLAERRPELY